MANDSLSVVHTHQLTHGKGISRAVENISVLRNLWLITIVPETCPVPTFSINFMLS